MGTKALLVLVCLMAGLAGCSVEKRLNTVFKGKSKEYLDLKMGKPTRSETAPGGRTVSVYEKSKSLNPAPINTGAYQYDMLESPKSKKTETYTFYFNPLGLVENVKYNVTYAR